MRPRSLSTALALSLAALIAPAQAQNASIADILPDGPILAAGVPNWDIFSESMKASGFGDFWRDDEIQSLVAKLFEEPKREFEDALKEIGAEPEDVKQPMGLIAGALYLDGEIDIMGDAPDIDFVIVADYDDNAEAMLDLIERVLEQGEESGEITVREDDYEDARLWIVEMVEMVEQDEGDEDWEDDWDAEPAFPWENITLALADGVFILSSDSDRLELSIDALAGDDIESIADNDTFNGSIAQHPDQTEAWTVFLPGDLLEAFGQGMAMSAPPGLDVNAMLDTLGISGIQSLSAGMRFADGDVLVEQTFAALVPEKRGIVALFDTEGGAFTPPSFVSPDTATASRISVDFEGILQVVRDAMAHLPEEMRTQPEAMFEGLVAPIAAPILASMGNELWITQLYTTPFAADSQQSLVIATTEDEGAMGDLLVNIPGMEGREFAGGMIYSNAMGADMGVAAPSIGLASGHVFIGMPESIENAMRMAANPAADSLGGEPRFRKGAAMLDDRALGYMYTDMAQAYRWTKWSMDNFDKIQRAQYEELGMDAEEIDEMMEWMSDTKPEWAGDMPSEKLIAKYIGDTFGQVQSTDEGFVWSSYWLSGDND